MLRASPPPPDPATSPPAPVPLLTDLGKCSSVGDPVISLARCPRRRTTSPPPVPPPPWQPRRRRLGRGPGPRRRRAYGTLAARRPRATPGAPFVGPGHPPPSGRPARHRARVCAPRPADARASPPASGSPRPLRAARLSTRRRPPLHPTERASPPRRCPTANLHPDGQKILRRGRGEGGGRQGSGKGGRRRDGRVEGEPHARNHCPPEPTTALRPKTTAHQGPPGPYAPKPPPTSAHQRPPGPYALLPRLVVAHHNPPQPTTALRSGQRRPTGAVSRFGRGPTSGRTPRAVTAQGRPRSAAGSVGISTLCAAPLVHTTTGRREQRIPSALLNLSCEPAD